MFYFNASLLSIKQEVFPFVFLKTATRTRPTNDWQEMFLGLLSIQHSLDQNLLRGTFKGFFFFSSAVNQASGRTPSSSVETEGTAIHGYTTPSCDQFGSSSCCGLGWQWHRFFCEELYLVSWRTQQINLLIRMEGKISGAINTRSCWFIECEIRGSRLVYSLETVLLEVSIATNLSSQNRRKQLNWHANFFYSFMC